MPNINNLLTVSDIAATLKVTPQYVRRLITEEKLRATRIGKQWLVDSVSLERYLSDYQVIIEPDDHARRSSELPQIVALSFFSGAMGLDLGMRQGGIKAVLACEVNKYCRMTIESNDPEIGLIGDINDYSPEDIRKMAKIPAERQIDVIFGGPPCQAFSTAGQRRGLDDARGNVFLRFIDIVVALRPTYVVIENVRGLLSAPYPYQDLKEPITGGALALILAKLESAGYTLSFELYNAANFGAPQIRERVVIIGKLGQDKVPYLSPTHSEHGTHNLPQWHTLGAALQPLQQAGITHHYIEFPEKRLKFYRLLTEGQYWKDLPQELQREAMGAKLELGGGKTGFFRRLSFSKPAPTLVTNPTMPATDLCHPTENRPLSVEEYACIQEFPQDWKLCGSILEQYRQIGNAVPVKLGAAIAKTIVSDMHGVKLPLIADFSFSRYKNTSDSTWKAQMRHCIEKARVSKSSQKNHHLLCQMIE